MQSIGQAYIKIINLHTNEDIIPIPEKVTNIRNDDKTIINDKHYNTTLINVNLSSNIITVYVVPL